MGNRPITLIAAIIFTIMALLHVYRLFTHFQIIAGSHTIPEAASYAAIVVTAALAIGLFREARR
ncbi:MAG TPA: hypothetical protein VF079_00930 [Sphingomicrobium sp.]